jgi:hypothetical protein
MPRRRFSLLGSSSLVLASLMLVCCVPISRASAGEITINSINTLDEMWGRLKQCWQSPRLPEGHPGMQITAMFTFQRNGEIFGKPRITFESPEATEADSIVYRTAVMETLQRCSPMPFTESMGSAIAGKPLRLRFDDRRNLPKPIEKRAWLTTTIL